MGPGKTISNNYYAIMVRDMLVKFLIKFLKSKELANSKLVIIFDLKKVLFYQILDYQKNLLF